MTGGGRRLFEVPSFGYAQQACSLAGEGKAAASRAVVRAMSAAGPALQNRGLALPRWFR